jgi:HD-GYP domain-containing protein (c-di-GMP phosphodiesterase class II)
MIETITIFDASVYSGYSYIGYCKEFLWNVKSRQSGDFIFKGLVCEYDFEEMMLRKDLFLRTHENQEYVLEDFVITDVSQIGKLQGSAKSIKMLDSSFPAIKAFIEDEKIVLSKETQLEAFKAVSDVVHQVKNDAVINGEQTRAVMRTLVDEVLQAPDAIMNLMDIKSFDDYTFTHNVNVSAISLLIGSSMGLAKDELEELATGCVLHDVGKIKIAIDLLNKEGSLSDEEFIELRSHPRQGYDILVKSRGLSEESRLVALQHHEKFQGNGYPANLRGNEISLYSRICSVADVYDALTTDRPYRLAMSPYDAIKILTSGIDRHFDPNVLTAFIRKIK